MNKADLKDAMDRMGLKNSNAAIASLFGIKEQAVQQWGDTVPELRQFHLQRDHADIYAKVRRRRTQRGE